MLLGEFRMPRFSGRQYDVRRGPTGWSWMVFAIDGRTPTGIGEAMSRSAAEDAARAWIADAATATRPRLAS